MATYTTTSHERPTDAGFARGDVINVTDPAAPITSWIHLGSGVWERNDTVQVRTGPGGRVGLTAGGIPVDLFAGRRQMRNSGVQMWEGRPTANMFTITGQSGAEVSTEQTLDGGLRIWTTVADRYIDLVMPLPVPMAVRAAALEISNLSQQNQCSIYFGVDATWAVDKMISRSFGVGGAALGTSRTGTRNHVWYSGSPPTMEWVNSANLPLDRTLMTHMRLRFAVQAGGVCDVTLYSLQINPMGRGRIAIVSDDGYASWLQRGWPLLQRRGIPSSIAVIPSLIDTTSRYCTLKMLREYISSGNEVIAHGTNRAEQNLFELPTHEARIADVQYTLDWLKRHGLSGPDQLRCYIYPQGRFASAQGDTSLIDALPSLGVTLGRTTTRHLGFSGDVIRQNSASALTVPIIGYIRGSTEANDTTELNNTINCINHIAQTGQDGVIMLHEVIPAQTTWASTTNGTIDITVDKLEAIADAIVTARKEFGLEPVLFSSFAPPQ